MLVGKFWQKPCGELLDTSTTEHVIAARAHILGIHEHSHERLQYLRTKLFVTLDAGDTALIMAQTPAQRKAQVSDALRFLEWGGDARVYAITEFNWLRIAKAGFWCKRFDIKTRRRINASAYWDTQYKADRNDVMTIVEVGTGRGYDVPVGKFRSRTTMLNLKRNYEVKSPPLV